MAKLHKEQIVYEIPTIPEVGAWVIFRGVTRADGRYGKTLALEYDAYEPMAIKEMQRIEEEAQKRFKVLFVEIHHRLGRVEVGNESMIVIVGAAHRREAFKAVEWVVDEVKHSVPIFKKEINEEGEFWIEEGTPDNRGED
ncbi:molybdenum cofactor biosynthesis protein MoaE [bacterium 3DAC]|nr:molybdenum cofactor biosynthesis protein MoaE [Dictyoglomota bacterium]UZN22786.1 molybdenum cofactor biosynthesis protein MoaE [bacterium 3DAC]